MTNTLTRLLLTAALCGLFLLSEAQERNAVSAPDPAAPRMPADSISRDYRLDGVVIGTQRPPSPLGSIAEGRFRLLMRNSSALPRFAGCSCFPKHRNGTPCPRPIRLHPECRPTASRATTGSTAS